MKNPKILQSYFAASSAYFAVLCHLFSVKEDTRVGTEAAVHRMLSEFDDNTLEVGRLIFDAIHHGVGSGYLERMSGDRLRLTSDGRAAAAAVADVHQTILEHTSLCVTKA